MNLETQAPIIESFRIEGLHGYKQVEINFESSIRIVIAENGSGKTTILSALHWFLTGNFASLRDIEFDSIYCKFNNINEPIRLDRDQLEGLENRAKSSNVNEFAEFAGLSLLEFEEYLATDFDENNRDEVFTRIHHDSPYSMSEIMDSLVDCKNMVNASYEGDLGQIRSKINEAIGEHVILYLPTYRRIEKFFGSEAEKGKFHRSGARVRSGRFRSKPRTQRNHMNYGLADVVDRLANITEDIQRRTNFGYREISAKIIEDLLTGSMEISSPQLSDLPDIETIRRFFSRVVRNEVLTTEYIDRIQSLYKVEGPLSANQSTLIYFLSQLSKVIDQTSQLEATIELFVERANKYLNSTSEEKWLEYDPDQMRVVVYNNWIPNHIDLNELSSGEKQIVSLLAHLFLYDSKKIILIDEPELSLSIDWQQKILVDIASAPSCQQLLAITHSPFIFDNVLDECAVPLSINRTKSELEADDEF